MRGLIALGLAAALVISCTTAMPPTVPPATPSPSPQRHPITMAMHDLPSMSNWLRFWTNNVSGHQVAQRMVHAGLYRHDNKLAAVPDLAAEPCSVSGDLLVITCHLRSAHFHDGTPVTAADVAYEFELARSPNCVWADCLAGKLASAEVVDATTVRFTLTAPYALFLSTAVADILIEPRSEIESAYAAFSRRAGTVDPEALDAMASRIGDAAEASPPDCMSLLDAAEQAARNAGASVEDRSWFPGFGGAAFDPCAYGEYLMFALGWIAESIRSGGTDAVAAAYPLLSFTTFETTPIGAGPWKVASYDPAAGLTLEAFDQYHFGRPQTPEIRIRPVLDTEAMTDAVAAGSVDWLPGQTFNGEFRDLADTPGVRLVSYPIFAWSGLQYNVRPGQLFSDRNLRKAVELCIDKAQIIAAAVPGAVPIYSPIPPASWAYQPGLARDRDVAGGRSLIEASGWTMGGDGIYQKDGKPLSFEVPTRGDRAPPLGILDRMSVQLQDCGMELVPKPFDFADLAQMLEHFPHDVPGTSQPFQAYLGGWASNYDPDVSDLFHSRSMTSPQHGGPGYSNYIGFSNSRVDQLLDEGLATYDQAARTDIYRQLQRVLADEQPYLFMSALPGVEALDADISSTSGPLDFSSLNWWWQLESLVNPGE